MLSKYSYIFKGIGRFLSLQYHIQVDINITPKQAPCRSILIHLKEAFKKEIDKMLQASVIKPVKEATPWINSFILVEGKDKSGNPKLHICLEPMNLNKAVISELYHFKTPEDITHLIANSCIKTLCNCKKGYWHQELDESSSFLTTFNTEFGRFWYTVMPFGITIAGDVFKQMLDQCFSHLKNIIIIADDIMIVGKNQEEHDLALTSLLDTARKCSFRLNYDKLQYKKTEVDFFGQTYMIDGHKLAQTKVSTINTMLELTFRKEVQSFIGMIIYLSKFSARPSKLSEPIRELSKERVPFNWGPEHREAFDAIKKELVKAPILAYCNPNKEVLQTDASIKGLGTCLLQHGKPVYFASKALTATQKGYVAIELESLAVAWAMDKFHHFLYGTHFIPEMDQKPLEAIQSKSLNQTTPQLQRILIWTFPYHFKVCHIPGPMNQLADCLSRLGNQKDNIKLPKLYVYQITSQLKARSDTLN